MGYGDDVKRRETGSQRGTTTHYSASVHEGKTRHRGNPQESEGRKDPPWGQYRGCTFKQFPSGFFFEHKRRRWSTGVEKRTSLSFRDLGECEGEIELT